MMWAFLLSKIIILRINQPEAKKMAARLRKTHQDDVRKKIKVTELINRVQQYALGELEDADVSSNRLNAIKLLLAKALPDLSSVEMTGKDGTPLMPPVIQFVKDAD